MDQISFLGKSPVVIDNGSGMMKAGFAGEEKPQIVFPSYVGKAKYDYVIPTTNQQTFQMGNFKEETRGLLKLKYPISHGIIKDWKSMDLIWNHIFQELKINTKETPIFLTEPPLNPFEQKLQTAQIFFENYGVPAFFMGVQGVLSLFATGKTTGVVLDCGDGVTHVIPIYDGYALNHAYGRIDLAGRDVTEHLQLLLRKSGINFTTSGEFEIVKKIKEKRCLLSISAYSNDKILEERKVKDPYILPDGNVIELSFEKTRAPEILFSPEKIGLECMSVPQLLVNSVNKTDIDLRKTFFSEIVLSGGSSQLTNFPDRLLSEARKLTPKDLKIKLFAPQERNLMCWMGGSIFSNLGSFKNMWIMKQDYEEQGERILLKKTF